MKSSKPIEGRKTILDEAKEIIYGDREQTYGRPDKNLNKIAALWSGYLDVSISAKDVCMMMVLMKAARQANAYRHDNLVDICGYAALNARLENGDAHE